MKYLFFFLTLCLLPAETIKVRATQPHDIFSLNKSDGVADQLLSYSNTKKVLEVFSLDYGNSKAAKAGSLKLDIKPQHALAHGDKILLASGQTLTNRDAPVEIALFNNDLTEKKIIHSYKSERSEITSLKHLGDGFLLTYYDSKYFTVTGKLSENENGEWEFKQLFRIRMATTTDSKDGSFLVARGYGDKRGDVGDATLVAGGKEVKLPTLNGVSSGCLAQLDDDPELEVILGDGWHMNYGKIAEPRVTFFNYDAEKDAYVGKVVSNVKVGKQCRLDKISVSNTGIVLAIGTEESYLFNPKKDWEKKVCPSVRIVDLGNNYYSFIKGGIKVEKIEL